MPFVSSLPPFLPPSPWWWWWMTFPTDPVFLSLPLVAVPTSPPPIMATTSTGSCLPGTSLPRPRQRQMVVGQGNPRQALRESLHWYSLTPLLLPPPHQSRGTMFQTYPQESECNNYNMVNKVWSFGNLSFLTAHCSLLIVIFWQAGSWSQSIYCNTRIFFVVKIFLSCAKRWIFLCENFSTSNIVHVYSECMARVWYEQKYCYTKQNYCERN